MRYQRMSRRNRITLDHRDRWIGGVCSGLANYFGTDPAFVRVGAVLCALLGSVWVALIAYAIAWCCFPERRRC